MRLARNASRFATADFAPLVLLLALAAWAAPGRAEEVYFVVPLSELKVTAGALPARPADGAIRVRRWDQRMPMPRVVLDGPGEAYFDLAVSEDDLRFGGKPLDGTLFARAPEGAPLRGKVYLPSHDWSKLESATFEVPADKSKPGGRQWFLHARYAHYDRLVQRQLPGGAWFRHQRDLTGEELWNEAPERAPRRRNDRPRDDLLDTFSFFTGTRAISDNLSLDRMLEVADGRPLPARRRVPIDQIKGITVREIDWKPLIQGKDPKLDPLASFVPHDQHAVFFPSFVAFTTLFDELEAQGAPLVQLAEARAEDAGTMKGYQRQLGLSMTAVGRLVGRQMVRSVAVTGSDAYLRVGSDVAILFETDREEDLVKLVRTQVGLVARAVPGAKGVEGDLEGIPYQGVVSPDRRVSSYSMKLGGAVAVGNSLEQMRRLAQVRKGTLAPIASLDEFRYFRDRYRLGDADETAFLMITDATLRRWCSPRWRIADSRRTRIAGALAALQARNLSELASGKVTPRPLAHPWPEVGPVRLTADGVLSDAHGSLAFMTPILESPIATVSEDEARAYEQWRTDYERAWTRFFDPIGVRVGVAPGSLSADVTIIPVLKGGWSEWRFIEQVAANSKIRPGSGAPDAAAAGITVAINRELAKLVETWVNGGKDLVSGWIGDSISLYAEQGPFWEEMARADDPGKFVEQSFHRLPVALRIEAADREKLKAFPEAFHQFLRTIDGNINGEPRFVATALEHRGRAYHRLSPSDEARQRDQDLKNVNVYHACLDDAWVISFDEKVITAALDRAIDGKAAGAAGAAAPAAPTLPESSARLVLGKMFTQAARPMLGRLYSDAMRQRCYANLPILNEWKRLHPDQDPVAFHEKFWQARLLCPGGGEYRWNEEHKTMESTVFGHPAQPKPGPALPPFFDTLEQGTFDLTFEPNDGIRTQVRIRRNR